jgi:outer membrane protein
MSKLGVGVLLSVALVLTPLVAAHAAIKIGVVDGMEIISKSPQGKVAQDNIKRKSEELGRPFAVKRQTLAREVKDFQKQASLMKESVRKQKAKELEQKMQEFQRQGQDAEKQLARYQQQQLRPLFARLETAVKSVATSEDLDLVLDKRQSGLLYMSPKLDITDKVRSRF